MHPLHRGERSDAVRALQAATNRRLRARALSGLVVPEDGVLGARTLLAVRKAAWALGALAATFDQVTKAGVVSVGVQRMIRNPGLRNPEQQARGKARMSALRHDRQQAAKREHSITGGRLAVVRNCLLAEAHYRREPSAYHYLAGGTPNLIYLAPSPRGYRSDCSQFGSSVQNGAGLPDLGPHGPLYVNTIVMAAHLHWTDKPQPGDFGMYGSRTAPHHVEVYCGQLGVQLAGPGHEYVGHGSPPIDSLTPGLPDFFLANPAAA